MNNERPPEPGEEKILEVDLEQGEEALPPVTSAPEAGGEVLVIEPEQLGDLPPVRAKTPPPDLYPSVAVPPAVEKPGKAGKAAAGPADLVGVLNTMLIGAIGGFIAWLLVEPFITDPPVGAPPEQRLLIYVLGAMGLFAACLGGMIGMALGSAEGLTSRAWEKAARGALLGLGIGTAGGFVGGVIGQAVYGGLTQVFGPPPGSAGPPSAAQIAARGLGWALVGLFVGIGQGAVTRAKRKMVNGLLGGLLGGLAGGLLFDPLAAMVAFAARLTGGTVGGEVSRLVAIVVMGAACGTAIGLVEQVRKEAWLRIVEGPLTGKQFIIYRSPTIIGASPKCDITLALDKFVAPQHAGISQQGTRYLLTDLGTSTGTRINGRSVRTHLLRSGDRIGIGQTTLLFMERPTPGAAPG